MKIEITSSHAAGSAPPGYHIVKVTLDDGWILEFERNPSSKGEWVPLVRECPLDLGAIVEAADKLAARAVQNWQERERVERARELP